MGQGGAEKVVFQLCSTLNVPQNHIYVASTGGYYVSKLSEINVKHFTIPDLEGKNIRTIVDTFNILSNIIATNNIDVIHTHHRMAAFYARLLQFKFRNLKHIYTAHNVFFDHKSLLKFALKKATIVACGDTVKKNLVDVYGISSNIINVIYNSVEKKENPTFAIESRSLEKGFYYIGYIGRLSKQKGVDVFIKAINKVVKSNPKIKGLIIGDGEERKKLEKLTNELNVKKNIYFLGYQNNVDYWLNQIEFVILPSRWEGLPLIPIETFANGKTIIVSNIPSNCEIVNDKYNGLIFKKDNVDDLVNKIKSMIAQKDALEKHAYDTYINNFSYSIFKKKYESLYSKTFDKIGTE